MGIVATRILQSAMGFCALLLATVTLAGWITGHPYLQAPIDTLAGREPSTIGMAPTTAVALICLSIAIIVSSVRTK